MPLKRHGGPMKQHKDEYNHDHNCAFSETHVIVSKREREAEGCL